MRYNDILTPYEEAGILDALDVEFARGVMRLIGSSTEKEPLVALGLAMASRAPAHGHLCFTIDLDAIELLPANKSLPPWPDPKDWIAALRSSPLIRDANDQNTSTPLVLDDKGRLYLDRYYRYEISIADAVLKRLSSHDATTDVSHLLNQLIPDSSNEKGVIEQRQAISSALSKKFFILTGGPGTGKTACVAAILLLLLHQNPKPEQLRIRAMAPTGKAAARLANAIRQFVSSAESRRIDPRLKSLLRFLPKEAATIHRSLGAYPDSPGRYRYHKKNLLPADIVVVDEASMVDAALMAALVDAISDDTRLILIGDRDQLASVEAGSILGDLCDGLTERSRLSRKHRHPVSITAGNESESGHVATLRFPFRFDALSDIWDISSSIRELSNLEGQALVHAIDGILAKLSHGIDGFSFVTISNKEGLQSQAASEARKYILTSWDSVLKSIIETVKSVTDATSHLEAVNFALDQLNKFMVLCATREGPFGVESVKRLVLSELTYLINGSSDWFEGCPLMVTENDYELGLFNGDTGVVLRDNNNDLVAWFQGQDRPRSFKRYNLPPYEIMFAVTIHKSQGCQFERVCLLLPELDTGFITREMVYTAITRAQKHVYLIASSEVLRAALGRRVVRASGLSDRLSGK